MIMNKFKKTLMTNHQIYQRILEVKGEIDTIAEEKGLDEEHDLCLASNHLDSFLNAMEESKGYTEYNEDR